MHAVSDMVRISFVSLRIVIVALALAACEASDSPRSAPPPAAASAPGAITTSATRIETAEEASRFLAFASFGATMDEIDALVGRDAADWLAEEMAKTPTTFTPRVLLARDVDGNFANNRIHQDLFWLAMMDADDQLRMRMMFALSQIFVASQDMAPLLRDQVAAYADVLVLNAFGNYRTLLEDVTYAPLMGRFLTYLRNRKGDPTIGRLPDENYAREIMQLFSIGLIELNPDGTPRLDANGDTIPTYDNDDIVGLARVFTGLSYDGTAFGVRATLNNRYRPMRVFEEEHSQLPKVFLTESIPAGVDGVTSLNRALDEIFAHPNVAPFIARQLIQRFTASNPSPAYVARVSAAFEAGRFTADNGRTFGSGARGDLAATLAAILLDPTVFQDPSLQSESNGKIREPILKFVHWVRAFDAANLDIDNEFRLNDTRTPDRLNQHFLRSPSVFNFYRPGYVAPQTISGSRNLTAPELQILNSTTAAGYINFMTEFALGGTGGGNGNPARFVPNYSAELALTDTPAALVDRLNLILTGNRLSPAARAEIVRIVESAPLRVGTSNEADDRMRRVETALMLIAGSTAYHIVQ